MIRPAKAPVRPRVVSPETGEVILLDDAICELTETTAVGAVELIGGRGAGKTTALEHLAATVGMRGHVMLLDEPSALQVKTAAGRRLVVFTSRHPHRSLAQWTYALASWTDDDLIEYLLTTCPSQCTAVMQRIGSDVFRRFIRGEPELWRIILDEMTEPLSPADIRAAIRGSLKRRLRTKQQNVAAGLYGVSMLLGKEEQAAERYRSLTQLGCPPEALRMMRHRSVQLLLAAHHLVETVRTTKKPGYFRRRLPRDLVGEVGRCVASDRRLVQPFHALARGRDAKYHSMTSSVLHAADIGWRPAGGKGLELAGGYFDHAQWSGIQLARTNLDDASVNRADLSEAGMDDASLRRCRMRAACLRGSSLRHVHAQAMDLANADLTRACARHAKLERSDLSGARLEEADLRKADLRRAVLQGASLRSANLSGAHLLGAQIEVADFSHANLSRAVLSRLPLREARLSQADFSAARLTGCDLEFVELPDAQFEGADLTGAWLTGAVMPQAHFRRACLRDAGLADVMWEDADLRDADLTGCSFHLGSSRSGLVGSPYPGHGSRTGFYDNTFDQHHYKTPEEIRKANLCRANLRGAHVLGADFYLVDLRGAHYDRHQEDHFRRCDAILDEND